MPVPGLTPEEFRSLVFLVVTGVATIALLLWMGRAKHGPAAAEQRRRIVAHREDKRIYRETLADPRARALADMIRGSR